MARNKFSDPNALPVGRLILLGLVITFVAAIFVQNLQPFVTVFFLGQASIALPLSLAMLIAAIGGGMLAAAINFIADRLQSNTRKPSSDRSSFKATSTGKKFETASNNDEYEENFDDFDNEDDEDTVEYGPPKQQQGGKTYKYDDRSDDAKNVIDVKYVDRKGSNYYED